MSLLSTSALSVSPIPDNALFQFASLPSLPFNGIAAVGEAWGEQESYLLKPFVGESGQELTRMLEAAGIQRSACYLTNLLHLRPERNDLGTLCTTTAIARCEYDRAGLSSLYPDYPYPSTYNYSAVTVGPSGGHLRPRFLDSLGRLDAELRAIKPRVVVALGNTALWALTGKTGIGKARGAIIPPGDGREWAIVPTYHPAAVLRKWNDRPTVIFDLIKARRAALGLTARPSRSIYVADHPSDFALLPPGDPVAVDIETAHGLITCVGLSPTPHFALVIPFVDKRAVGYSYWTREFEILAWRFIQQILSSRRVKLFHNGAYDLSWFLRDGFGVSSFIEDTMLAHHAAFPEISKSLRYLASIYTDELAWKDMRRVSSGETTKRGDAE